MKIGIYGGSFNPIHSGHIRLAEHCANTLQLDKVIFVPALTPPHKIDHDLASSQHRLNMCRLATASNPIFEVSDIEITRSGVSYTIYTLWDFVRMFEGAELYLIVGSDMYFDIKKWKMHSDIFKLVRVVTAPRENLETEKMLKWQKQLESEGFESIVLSMQPVVVSSTAMRSKIDKNFLPDEIAEYIVQNSLYQYSNLEYKYDVEKIYKTVETIINNDNRMQHSLSVAKKAQELAKIHGVSEHHAYVAGLVHDVCKTMSDTELLEIISKSEYEDKQIFLSQNKIWHAFAGSLYIKDVLNILCSQIIESVRYHTTGKSNMTVFEKIIYLADIASADRIFDDVEQIREMCYNDLDKAMAYVLRHTMKMLSEKSRPVFKDTLEAYNFYTLKLL